MLGGHQITTMSGLVFSVFQRGPRTDRQTDQKQTRFAQDIWSLLLHLSNSSVRDLSVNAFYDDQLEKVETDLRLGVREALRPWKASTLCEVNKVARVC